MGFRNYDLAEAIHLHKKSHDMQKEHDRDCKYYDKIAACAMVQPHFPDDNKRLKKWLSESTGLFDDARQRPKKERLQTAKLLNETWHQWSSPHRAAAKTWTVDAS